MLYFPANKTKTSRSRRGVNDTCTNPSVLSPAVLTCSSHVCAARLLLTGKILDLQQILGCGASPAFPGTQHKDWDMLYPPLLLGFPQQRSLCALTRSLQTEKMQEVVLMSVNRNREK